jgi:hypothetical protein
MRGFEEQEEKAGKYGVSSRERWEIYMFGWPIPTRRLEWL